MGPNPSALESFPEPNQWSLLDCQKAFDMVQYTKWTFSFVTHHPVLPREHHTSKLKFRNCGEHVPLEHFMSRVFYFVSCSARRTCLFELSRHFIIYTA